MKNHIDLLGVLGACFPALCLSRAVLDVFQKPTYTPSVSVASTMTPISFLGALHGDFVVLQPDNCLDAHLQVTTNRSMTQTAIYDPSSAYVHPVLSTVGATVRALVDASGR